MSNLFIVDDQDASIKYTGLWNVTGQQADFSQTASSASSDATMTFSFSGSFISVIGDLYAGGTCNGTFSIDGTVSNFTSAATSITQNQQTLWSSSALNEGNHTLIYTASSCNSSQSFVSIDYLLYNSSSTSVSGATSFFDDRNSSLVYSGNSNSTSGIGDFQGTITGLQKGGSFQFGFNGTSVQVYGRVDNASVGVVDASFSVDGAPSVPFTAVTSNNVVHNKQFFASRTLNPGQHTLIVNNTGDNPVWVDYVLVRGQTSIGGAAPAANTSGSSHLRLDIVIASVVGGVVGIALLVGVVVFMFRRHSSMPSFLSRSKNRRTSSPPPHALESEAALAPHHPKFVPQDIPSSLSEAANSSVELHPLTHRRFPHSQNSSTHDLSFADDSFAASEFGYHDENFLGNPLQPQPSREGSLVSLPNPYSIRQGHRSYRSESSMTQSVAPSQTAYSSYAYTDEGPRVYVTSVSEHSSIRDSSSGYGYGFSAAPPRRVRRSTVANMSTDEEENLSVAELKRRQGEVYVLSVNGMHSEPLVHTDSGIRLRNPELQPELPPMYTAE